MLYTLEVAWGKDGFRVSKENAKKNISLLRKIALNFIYSRPTKILIRGKRFQAALYE